jgi:signal transduction histidine kinase
LPLRSRLVAGFTVATLVVLLAAGGFIYWRVDTALDRDLDAELTQARGTIDPLVDASGAVSDRTVAEATGAAWQVLGTDGSVLAYGGPAGPTPLISEGRLDRVRNSPRTYDVGSELLPVSGRPYRVHVARTSASSQHFLLVGVRSDHRDETLRELLAQLAIAGLGTLVVTALVGERLARAALRPVERYRRRAADIAAGSAELRLDVPAFRDDEITRLGHTFNDMLATLETALDRERQFVNAASHELRTPIALLAARIQLAQRRPRTQAEHEHVLTELRVDLDRLARLADQLLQLGRTGAVDNRGPSDLTAVATRTVDHRRIADPARAGEVTAALPAHRLWVPVADVEVERVLTNLLDNAATHGAAPFALGVDAPAAGWARLTVTDHGPGMPPDLLQTATQRFARADEARTRPGSGLGLALVETLVTEAGGELRLCHEEHHVSHGGLAPVPCAHPAAMTVTVLLPQVPEPAT